MRGAAGTQQGPTPAELLAWRIYEGITTLEKSSGRAVAQQAAKAALDVLREFEPQPQLKQATKGQNQ